MFCNARKISRLNNAKCMGPDCIPVILISVEYYIEVVIVVCNCGANCLLGGLPGFLEIFFQPPIVQGSCLWQLLGIKDIFEKLPRLDYQNVMIG